MTARKMKPTPAKKRVAWIGENGINAGVRYRLSDAGEFVEVVS